MFDPDDFWSSVITRKSLKHKAYSPYSAKGPWNRSLNVIFPSIYYLYIIPQSLFRLAVGWVSIRAEYNLVLLLWSDLIIISTAEKFVQQNMSSWWLNHPFEKCAREIGSFPQVGLKIKRVWNHHPDVHPPMIFSPNFLQSILVTRGRRIFWAETPATWGDVIRTPCKFFRKYQKDNMTHRCMKHF